LRMQKPIISFYCPSKALVAAVPSRIADYWQWINEVIPAHPAKLPPGEFGEFCLWHGPYSWTVQTWIHLRENEFECDLVSEIPDEGIIISHSDFWPTTLRPSSNQFLVEIKPDRNQNLRQAQFVLVQSAHDPLLREDIGRSGRVAVVPYWPQPSLIRRDSRRSTQVRQACFLGNGASFLSDVEVLTTRLEKIGILFKMPPRALWNDYSEVDLVIAVRDQAAFSSTCLADTNVLRKPPNKLINAWLAEVPAILSPEPSYLDLRLSSLDFVDAKTVKEIVTAAERLKVDGDLYNRMIDNGRKRAAGFGSHEIVANWISILTSIRQTWADTESH